MSKDYTPPVYISNADTNGEPTPRPHHRHKRPERTNEEKRRVIGRVSAWTCTTLYLTSRLPQIWKNVSASRHHHSLDPDTCIQQYTRKSVQGLSLALFVFAFLGNLFYVLSILTSPVLYSAPAAETPSPSALPNAALPSPPLLATDVLPNTGWSSPAGVPTLPAWFSRDAHLRYHYRQSGAVLQAKRATACRGDE
jgi:hypothetical protein